MAITRSEITKSISSNIDGLYVSSSICFSMLLYLINARKPITAPRAIRKAPKNEEYP
jgi:hypothetical protein